jgi:hypothetical protein
MSLQCRDCRDGSEHCHGTVIHHAQRRSECTEDDCDSPDRIPHMFSVDCDVAGCSCGQSAAMAV